MAAISSRAETTLKAIRGPIPPARWCTRLRPSFAGAEPCPS